MCIKSIHCLPPGNPGKRKGCYQVSNDSIVVEVVSPHPTVQLVSRPSEIVCTSDQPDGAIGISNLHGQPEQILMNEKRVTVYPSPLLAFPFASYMSLSLCTSIISTLSWRTMPPLLVPIPNLVKF